MPGFVSLVKAGKLESVDGKNPSIRYPELDACRGIAILMMVVFHVVFDLSFFSLCSVDVQHGFWRIFGYATAGLFVLIAGIAVSVKSGRFYSQNRADRVYIPFFTRGLLLMIIGFGITFATYVFLQGQGYVVFGILHLIGASTILAPLFFRLQKFTIVPGIVIILISWFFTFPKGPIWLSWIGIHPAGFVSVDYTPLFPWFGVFLLGMGVGFLLYPHGYRNWMIPDTFSSHSFLPVWMGRHSLSIYLVHQPVLLIIFGIVTGKIPGF